MTSFGAYLKSLRLGCHLSLGDVQKQCGITNSRLSRAERDEGKSLSPGELRKLSQLYKVDVILLYIKAGYLSDKDLEDYKQVFIGAELLTNEEHKCIQTCINLLSKGRTEADLCFLD